MSTSDDMNKLALTYLDNVESLPSEVRDAFRKVPSSPLATLIGEYLQAHPRTRLAPLLRRIAAVNQGSIEDLNAPAFKSYLVSECDTDDARLSDVIRTLNTYQSIRSTVSAEDARLLVAARNEDNTGISSATTSEVLRELGKRVK